MKDPYNQDHKPKYSSQGVGSGSGSRLGPQCANTKLLNKSKKQKSGPKKNKFNTLISSTHTTEAGTGWKSNKQKRENKNKGDINNVICYNCDKKGYYTTTYP